jgi:hypothetical protein
MTILATVLSTLLAKIWLDIEHPIAPVFFLALGSHGPEILETMPGRRLVLRKTIFFVAGGNGLLMAFSTSFLNRISFLFALS